MAFNISWVRWSSECRVSGNFECLKNLILIPILPFYYMGIYPSDDITLVSFGIHVELDTLPTSP
tara:strand:+ start:73 stop:264 length:192 start_codon:yes stop_codon:yes gene_type:complete